MYIIRVASDYVDFAEYLDSLVVEFTRPKVFKYGKLRNDCYHQRFDKLLDSCSHKHNDSNHYVKEISNSTLLKNTVFCDLFITCISILTYLLGLKLILYLILILKVSQLYLIGIISYKLHWGQIDSFIELWLPLSFNEWRITIFSGCL